MQTVLSTRMLKRGPGAALFLVPGCSTRAFFAGHVGAWQVGPDRAGVASGGLQGATGTAGALETLSTRGARGRDRARTFLRAASLEERDKRGRVRPGSTQIRVRASEAPSAVRRHCRGARGACNSCVLGELRREASGQEGAGSSNRLTNRMRAKAERGRCYRMGEWLGGALTNGRSVALTNE